jgi:drug/metabolite transporter (DMT)-like permease
MAADLTAAILETHSTPAVRFAALTGKGANMNLSTEVHSQNNYLVGVILVLIGTLFFSAKSIFIKKAYEYGMDPNSLMVLRMAMAAPFYLLVYLLGVRPHQHKIVKMDIVIVCAIGVLGYYVASYLDLSGLMFISASFERMILYLFPSFVLIISVIFFKHKLTLAEVLAFILSYLGIMVIYAQDFQSYGHEATYGMLLVLGSAMAFSVFVVLSGKYIVKVGAMQFTSISMLGASVAVFLHYLFNVESSLMTYESHAYSLVFILALFCTVLPSYLINMGIKRVGAPRAAIVGTISPVFTVLMAYVFLNEVSTTMHIAGFVLVIMGIALITLSKHVRILQPKQSATE